MTTRIRPLSSPAGGVGSVGFKGKGTTVLLLSLLLTLSLEPSCAFSAPSSSNVNGGKINGVGPDANDEVVAFNGDDLCSSSEDNFCQQLQIAFVTGNSMKAREMNMILAECTADDTTFPGRQGDACKSGVNSSLVNLRLINVDLPEIQEVNTEAIAKEKALLGAQLAGGPCVVEDTSLQFTSLGGMPGPYIKWFQERLGSEGLYNILTAYEDKSAQAVCTLAFCPYPHADPVLFTGITHGVIVEPVKTGQGFGWDSIFVPDGSSDNIPFSQMTTEEKNTKSHRGKAVRQWATWLKRNQKELWERQSGRPAIGHKGLDFKGSTVED